MNVAMLQWLIRMSNRFISLKMQINDEPKDPDWDVCWTDFMIMPRNFIRMHFHQTINYIPGISAIARKNFLGRNLNDMKIKFPT